MIQCLSALSCRAHEDLHLFTNRRLANEIPETAWPDYIVNLCIVIHAVCGNEAMGAFHSHGVLQIRCGPRRFTTHWRHLDVDYTPLVS
jgi:hypothetical protein